MKQIMCDPPSGWKYGFPKPLPEHLAGNLSKQPTDDANEYGETVMEWIVKEGYPQEEINKCGEHFWLRYWEAE
jgi:hypothetical protein